MSTARVKREAIAHYAVMAKDPVANKTIPAPQHKVCFYGSSTFTYWKNIRNDFQRFQLFNAAFGGSTTSDLLMHIQPLVTQYDPTIVVYHCGANDICQGKSPTQALLGFTTFVHAVKQTHAHMKIIYVCPLDAPLHVFRRTSIYVDELCGLAMDYCHAHRSSNIYGVDPNVKNSVADLTDKKYYLHDGLHLTIQGHEKLAMLIMPVLQAVARDHARVAKN